MNLYVSTTEIKTMLGISGSAKDSLIPMLNKAATAVVNGIIGASDLALHKVSAEVHDSDGQIVQLNEKHVVAIGTVLNDDAVYTQDEEYDMLADRIMFDDYLIAGRNKLKIDYAAGWNASGMAKITVSDIANLAADASIELGAISNDGYTLTRGTDWTAGTTENEEAEKIAAAIDAKEGTRAFALGADIYVIEGTNPQVVGRTITVSDSVRLALSAGTLGSLNFPEDIRLAIFMLIGSMMQNAKNPKVKSYTIGSKTVSFASDAEFTQFKEYLKPHMRVFIQAI